MEESSVYLARVQVVEAMEQGLPWHEAAKRAGITISQSTAYRMRQRVHQRGEQGLREGRHGHPAKLRGQVREWLEETSRRAPHTPSHEIQAQLAERFALSISVSQINRVRATLGVSNPPQSAKKTLGWQVYLDVRSFTGKTKGDFTLISRQVCHPRFFCTVGKSPIEIA